jgi:3-hydroxyacyl-CoA dehydrogenase
MEKRRMGTAAVIGTGLIGRAWAVAFAHAGFLVRLWDPDKDAVKTAYAFVAARLPELDAAGLLAATPEEVLARVTAVPTLEAALEDAVWAQESAPEHPGLKRKLFETLDSVAAKATILASSSSGIPASAFTEKLRGRHRCLVAHPTNPPYLTRVVELCPSPWTAATTRAEARAVMERTGMVPVELRREVPGLVLNRLQFALLAEAFRLASDGVVSPQDLEAAVKHGLGPRWSFMGPFETIDLDAPGGVADYCARNRALYDEVQQAMTACHLTPELVEDVTKAQRALLPLKDQPKRQVWRDRRLMTLLAHQATQPA